MLVFIGVVSASIPFTTQEGAPGTVKCEDVVGYVWNGEVYYIEDIELTFDDGEQAFVVDGVGTIWIDAKSDDPMGQYFDWHADFGPEVIIVKAGPRANIYNYKDYVDATPGVADTYADTGLHGPENASGKWADISHIDLCGYAAPEFPMLAVPVGMIIGFLGVVTVIRGKNE